MDASSAFFIFMALVLAAAVCVALLLIATPILSLLLKGAVVVIAVYALMMIVGVAGPTEERPRLTSDKLISMMDINMSTAVVPGNTMEHWAISASGVIENKSDRVVSQIKVWCRVESLNGQETDTGWISIDNLKPGERKSFSGQIGGQFYGITEKGKTLRVAPRDRFCRVADIEEA